MSFDNYLMSCSYRNVIEGDTVEIYYLYLFVYFDNYFNIVNLMYDLLQNNTYDCVTVLSNRKHLPKNILLKQTYGKK